MDQQPPAYAYKARPDVRATIVPGQWYHMDPKVKVALALKAFLGMLFIFAFMIIGPTVGLLSEEGDLLDSYVCYFVPVLAVIVPLVLAITWAVLFYNRYAYMVDDGSVYINRGILWKRNVVIPFERVQHTTVTRGPVEILLGLSSLSIFTAGTASVGGGFGPGLNMMAAEGSIPGLRDPEPLKGYIMSMVKQIRSGSGLGDQPAAGGRAPPQAPSGTEEAMLHELKAIRRMMEERHGKGDAGGGQG